MYETPNQQSENRFLAALARFEHCLETPVVPGELQDWSESARESSDEVGSLLSREVSETHKDLLRHITREDIELLPRVEELKSNDRELLIQWNDIQLELNHLCEQVDRAEPNELKLDERVESVTKKAIAFIIEARKQEAALTTWYTEALNRDRGIAD